MREGSKSGPGEVKRYSPMANAYDEYAMLYWPVGSKHSEVLEGENEFVLASDYDSLRTQLSAVEAERDRMRRAAVEAMALIGELRPIDFKDTDKGERYAARAHDILFAALASESSATAHIQV